MRHQQAPLNLNKYNVVQFRSVAETRLEPVTFGL